MVESEYHFQDKNKFGCLYMCKLLLSAQIKSTTQKIH